GSEWDLAKDRRYAGISVPATESLRDTIARVLPYWEERIAPLLKDGKRIIVSAHGNSLRALVKHLNHISDEDISSLEIPTGKPILFELDNDLAVTDHYYVHQRSQLAAGAHGTASQPSA
ncbi:MAG: 2,3-bisphosphoglycerate-dependent phosphoglycerate mutase, partial [Sphingomonas sp.]